jgi:hypothetical protein
LRPGRGYDDILNSLNSFTFVPYQTMLVGPDVIRIVSPAAARGARIALGGLVVRLALLLRSARCGALA